METRLFIITINILIIMAFIANFSSALDEKAYIAKEKEELYGTWANEDYNSSTRHAIFEYKADGALIIYRKTTDESPYEECAYAITEKWTESNGDVCYKIIWENPYTAMSGTGLNCISSSGTTMESANSFSDYPTQIDRSSKDPWTYLGIHYRKQK